MPKCHDCRAFESPLLTLADFPSVVADRTNNPRWISSDKGIRGNVLGDYRTRRDNRVLADCYATDNGRAGCDPNVSLNHDGLSDCGGVSLGRFKGMARRDDAHVRPIITSFAMSRPPRS